MAYPYLTPVFLLAGQARNSQTPCDRRETLGRRNKQVCDRRRSDLNYRIMEIVRLMEKIPSNDQKKLFRYIPLPLFLLCNIRVAKYCIRLRTRDKTDNSSCLYS